MNRVNKATQTQLTNIQVKTGKTLEQPYAVIRESGLIKHSEIMTMLKTGLGLGHGDANALALAYKNSLEVQLPERNDVLDEIYLGPKAGLRAIHEQLEGKMTELGAFKIAATTPFS